MTNLKGPSGSGFNKDDIQNELQVSIFNTVYHPELGQLCQGHRQYGCYVSVPIRFNSREDAWKWIREGTIGRLQEGLNNLHVGFTNSMVKSN